jgi:hypothetical protein
VRRVLFDENLPRLLRRKLSEFHIRTVQEEGWGAYKNGELLRRAEGHFDVAHCRSPHAVPAAVNRVRYRVVVIVTPRLQLDILERALEPMKQAISSVAFGEVIRVTITNEPEPR